MTAKLWTWGDNQFGGLGLEDDVDHSSPEQVGSLGSWSSFSCGYYSTFAIKSGTLWAWGYNTRGGLGQEDILHRSSPEQVGSATNWKSVVGGSYHTVALKTNGTLWSWGYNDQAQLGLGDLNVHRSSPEQIGSLADWDFIGGGSAVHNMAIKTNGTLWTWGDNAFGQLGLEDQNDDRSSPEQVGALPDWIYATGGQNHTIALRSDHTIWSWGENFYGQLGQEDRDHRSSPEQVGLLDNWNYVGCGYFCTFAVKTDGTLWAWGDNNQSQMGLGDTDNRSSPVQIGDLTDWAYVTAGFDHVIAVKTNGTLWTWGNNDDGELGQEDTTTRSSPEQVGSSTSWSVVDSNRNYCAAFEHLEGSVCWGHKTSVTTDITASMLGNWTGDGNIELSGDAEKMTLDTPVIQESETWYTGAGEFMVDIDKYRRAIIDTKPIISYKTAASKVECEAGSTLWSWGDNGIGQLGLGDAGATDRSSPEQVGSLTNWGSVFGGEIHTTAIKTDRTVWSWGDNEFGQLGLEDELDRSSPVQVGLLTDWSYITGGRFFTAALKTDGTLWTWGSNDNGQLGLGDVGAGTDRSSPEQVGALSIWKSIDGGGYHTAAIKTDGTLWTWGRNTNGQLGLENVLIRSSPEQVGSLTNWSFVACGGLHTTAIKTDGTLWAWGYNQDGGLGLGDVGATTYRSSPEQVGSLTNWSSVAGGRYFTAAIKTDGTLWTWGDNQGGQLGIEDIAHRSSPEQVGSLTDWKSVGCGFYHTSSIKTDGTIWAWGYNLYGQLGLENALDNSSPEQIGSLSDWSSITSGRNHVLAFRGGFKNYADDKYTIDSLGWVKLRVEI